MNFAFPAIFILLLVLPGVVCRYWYRKGNWKHPLTVEPIVEETAKSVLLALILHALWIGVVGVVGYPPDLRAAFTLMVGHADAAFEQAVAVALATPGAVFAYFTSVYIASGLAGYGAHRVVRGLKLDHKYRLFRFDNPWYYLFSGELGDFPENADEGDDERFNSGLVYLAAVMQQGNGNYLYYGQIESFEFDRLGNLDRIMLRYAVRRKLEDDRGDEAYQSPYDDARYYTIGEGSDDFLVLRYADLRTLNVEYTYISVESA